MSTTDVEARRLRRDGQQWFFDWMIQETGKVFHFQTDGRGPLPKAVRRHSMISKHVGLGARRMEKIADEERAAGHDATALARYFDACTAYATAQHTIMRTNDEKRYLHGASIRCYDRVRELSPYHIGHLDIPWEDSVVSGNLHLCPGDEPKPLVFFIPGCDMTKEMYPHPQLNHAHQRGLHIFSFDGPGQGESNVRGIRLTADNYERAASAAITHLLARPEVDADQLVVFGISFGSFWALRVAAHDERVKAVAAPWASYCDKYHLMQEESPRYKQLFMYLTGAQDEDELDEIVEAMDMRDVVQRITCPTLEVTGEFDPRSPLEEVYELFDLLTCPAELWVFGDQHHKVSLTKPNSNTAAWQGDMNELALDWLKDRIDGRQLPDERLITYLPAGGSGPVGAEHSTRRRWYEDA
ncbi:MAG TPA: alpha/beta fold hydrolase [Gaiellaceae bacterium]|jgi:pimeloyl-ACP methyl ester carboxylesterase